MASALRGDGLFLFTVETHDSDDDYLLAQTARYSHSGRYIEKLAERREFGVLVCKDTVIRKQGDEEVKGLIVALRKN